MSKSLRSKVDQFFADETQTKMVASRALDNDGLGLDDDGEHMHRDFFGHKVADPRD